MTYGNVNVDTVTTSTPNGILGAGDASIMKNRIINGAMVISQRGTGSTTVASSGYYSCDMWNVSISQASKVSIQQNAGSVTPPVGFKNYVGITTVSSYTPSAGDYGTLRTFVEGYNAADLAWGTASAKTVTLSFQVYSSLTGTFGGALQNNAGNRSYPFTFSIPVANTWTSISITIAGDTTGTWATDNSRGIEVDFNLGNGSSNSGTAGSWQAAGYYSATGSVNMVATASSTFYLTAVQLEVGSSATGFEYVNYQTSLANCQRYYARLQGTTTYSGFGAGAWFSTTQCNIYIKYPQTMRTSPTVGYGGTVSCMINGGTQVNISGTGTAFIGSDSCMIQPSGLSGATTGQGTTMSANNDSTAYIFFSAEL